MIKSIRNDVYNTLNSHPKRLFHVNDVMLIASNLAIKYGANLDDTYIAALTHDYAKYGTDSFFKKYITIGDLESFLDNKVAYHGIAAANYMKIHYNINDDTYNAIYNHVFGRPKMSLLEKIVFISDSIYLNGPNNTGYLYNIALEDLNKALIIALEISFKELKIKGLKPHKIQLDTYNYYKEVI